MTTVYEAIDDRLATFIRGQHLFFVGTAPTGTTGHVNVSPKGLDALRVLGPTTVAYLDYVGSGVETIAHLRENGRIVIMLCAFEGPPRIVRLHGRGEVVEPDDPAFAILSHHFGARAGTRAIVRITLDRVSDSCGFGVPRFRYEGPRLQLPVWVDRKGRDGLEAYQRDHNRHSIDRLPGLQWTESEPAASGSPHAAEDLSCPTPHHSES